MTIAVARPPAATINIRAPYKCDCGRDRAILVRNLNTALPIGDGWRPLGECKRCGLDGFWQIQTRGDRYVIRIEKGFEVDA